MKNSGRYAASRLFLGAIAIFALGTCLGVAHAAPPPAGISMRWNDCAGGPTATSGITYACNGDADTMQLVCSVVVPSTMTNVIGAELVIDIQHSNPTSIPDWWRLDGSGTMGCRAGGIDIGFDFSANPGCTDTWLGNGFGGLQGFTVGPPDHPLMNQGRVKEVAAVLSSQEVSLTAGTTYGLLKVVFNSSRTTTGMVCPGCGGSACLVFNSVWIRVRPGSGSDVFLSMPASAESNWATWQGTAANCTAVPVAAAPGARSRASTAERRFDFAAPGMRRLSALECQRFSRRALPNMTKTPPSRLLSTLARLALAGFALAVTLLAGTARADEPTVYLTWHAPYGQPGASDTLSANCDSTRSDTLWLAFNPGGKSPTFLAMGATLLIHPRMGDSLSKSWSADTLAGFNLRFLKPDADPVPGLGFPQPWKVNGVGVRSLEEAGRAMRFRLIYATPYQEAISIENKIYVLARIAVQRPVTGDPRCGEPICIEWSKLELGFAVGDDRNLNASGAHRFVSLNSRGGEVSIPYRQVGVLHGWKPATP